MLVDVCVRAMCPLKAVVVDVLHFRHAFQMLHRFDGNNDSKCTVPFKFRVLRSSVYFDSLLWLTLFCRNNNRNIHTGTPIEQADDRKSDIDPRTLLRR